MALLNLLRRYTLGLTSLNQGGVTPIHSVLPPATGVKLLVNSQGEKKEKVNGQALKTGEGQRSRCQVGGVAISNAHAHVYKIPGTLVHAQVLVVP